jgi:hypothetical protein
MTNPVSVWDTFIHGTPVEYRHVASGEWRTAIVQGFRASDSAYRLETSSGTVMASASDVREVELAWVPISNVLIGDYDATEAQYIPWASSATKRREVRIRGIRRHDGATATFLRTGDAYRQV